MNLERKGGGNRGKVELKLISIITVIRLADICLKVLNYIVIRLVVKQSHATYKAAEEPAKDMLQPREKNLIGLNLAIFFVCLFVCVFV